MKIGIYIHRIKNKKIIKTIYLKSMYPEYATYLYISK
jgi:hypothetical protein